MKACRVGNKARPYFRSSASASTRIFNIDTYARASLNSLGEWEYPLDYLFDSSMSRQVLSLARIHYIRLYYAVRRQSQLSPHLARR
jgi:hypothetical protein